MNNVRFLINKSEDYINNHLGENITLDDLSRHIGISKYHFHRLFRESNDETIKQFILRVKMERSAIYLLIRNDITITEVAQRYGYSDSSSYTKAFKKIHGVSPTTYRKARKDNL